MQLVSVAGGSPVLLVQKLIDDNLYLVVVLPQEAGVEITISKPHCHKPFHWAPRGRGSPPLTTHPLGDILAANPLRCVLHGRAGERGSKCIISQLVTYVQGVYQESTSVQASPLYVCTPPEKSNDYSES